MRMSLAFICIISLIGSSVRIGHVKAGISKRKIKIFFSVRTALPPIADDVLLEELPMPSEEDTSQREEVSLMYQSHTPQEDAISKIKDQARINERFSPWKWRIGNQVFGFTTDTLEIELADQALDTLFIRETTMGKDSLSYYLLKFRHEGAYRISLDLDESSWSIQPSNRHKESDLRVSFQLQNYRGKDEIRAKAGQTREEEPGILLKNNTKTSYYQATSANRWYNWGRIGLYPLAIINQTEVSKKRKHVSPAIFIPFQELHGEKLDVSYDYKTKEIKITILN